MSLGMSRRTPIPSLDLVSKWPEKHRKKHLDHAENRIEEETSDVDVEDWPEEALLGGFTHGQHP